MAWYRVVEITCLGVEKRKCYLLVFHISRETKWDLKHQVISWKTAKWKERLFLKINHICFTVHTWMMFLTICMSENANKLAVYQARQHSPRYWHKTASSAIQCMFLSLWTNLVKSANRYLLSSQQRSQCDLLIVMMYFKGYKLQESHRMLYDCSIFFAFVILNKQLVLKME